MPGRVKRELPNVNNDGDGSNPAVVSPQFKRLRTGSHGHQANGLPAEEEGGGRTEESQHTEEEEEEEGEEDDQLDGDGGDDDDDDMYEGGGANTQSGTGGESGIGVIEKVSLTNFMCHDRMEVNLGPKLNFIIGHNGSGKSAILTGITIALGGKATATSRGNSLKSFVKEGKQTATVEVTLKNEGAEAFKPHQYKNKIIIERTIRADGQGSWKIKDANARLVSTKREELNAICDHCNIQVDNPMNILTQDSARQFLSASHSDEKYQFFLRGTQLAQLASEYDIIQLNSTRIRQHIVRKEEGLPLLRQKAREANDMLEIVQKAADQQRLVSSLRERLVWASVEEKENELLAFAERFERLKLKREKIDEKLRKSQEDEQSFEATITNLEKETSKAMEQEAPIVAEMRRLKDEEKVFLTEIKNAKEIASTLNDQYVRLKLQIDGVASRIEAETRKLRDGNQEKRTMLLNQKKQAELEKRKFEAQEVERKDAVAEFEKEFGKLEEAANKLQNARDRLRSEVASSEQRIAGLRIARSNRMAAFGTNIPALLQLIERERRWRQKPVGPIGAHLKVRDGKWVAVLESVLGNTLNAFCVTTHHDRNILQELKHKARCDEITILTGSDENFDYSAGEPEKDVLTILRVLDIESGFLTRQLINSLHIEQSALVEKRADGDNLVRDRKTRNVRFAYSMDLYRISGGKLGSGSQTIQPYRGSPRLTTDIEAQLQEEQRRHAQIQEELKLLTRQWENLQMEKREITERSLELKQSIPDLRRQARNRHEEMGRLDEELREDEPTNIHALVEARKDFEMEQNKIPEKIQESEERRELNENLMKPLIEKRLGLKKTLELIQEQSRALKPRLDEAATSRLKAHSEGIHWERELAKLRPKEEDLQSSVLTAEKEVSRRTAAAEGHCPRVEAGKSVQELEKQIESVENQLRAAAKRHGMGVEAITLQVKQYSEAFQKANVEIKALKEVLRDLEDAIKIRLDKWRHFRRIIAVRAKNMFSMYLSKRGFSGKLTFDHDAGKLRLTVKTDEATSGHRDKDPKSLSGGEKSFATICLLLALWESIQCPIRCLDEFDVFMDAVNRKITLRMMIDAAKGSEGIQYVLITPQAMNSVNLGNSVRVHRLKDPERSESINLLQRIDLSFSLTRGSQSTDQTTLPM